MSPFLTPIRIALLAAFAVVLVAGFVLVPAGAILPVHWGPNGEADGFLPREAALLMPALMLGLVWAIFFVIGKFGSPKNVAGGRHGMEAALTVLTALALTLEAIIVLIGIGVDVNAVQIIALALGVLLIVLGNAMPKSQPNSFAGLRISTTLRDAGNWQATHRLAGMLFIAAGVVLLVAALLVPASGLVWWLLACVFAPVVIGTGYSLAYARRSQRS